MVNVVITEEAGPLSHQVFKEGEDGEEEADEEGEGDAV